MMENILDTIHWLGHDAFRIDGDVVIYFDPFQIKSGPKGDIVLISHEHFDHCSPEDLDKISDKDTVILANQASSKKISVAVNVLKPGDTWNGKGIEISVVPAYNTNKRFHPRDSGGLGFIVTIDGVTIYHAGDTDFIQEMSDIHPDIALIPVSGTYVMDSDEAVRASLAIGPKVVIPMHYGSIVGSIADAEKFRDSLKGKITVKILPKE